MDREAWNSFVTQNGPRSGSFLHSWEWGEFQKAAGTAVTRVEAEGALAQIILRSLPLGQQNAYLPRGPIFSPTLTAEQKTEFLKKVIAAAREQRSLAMRVDPADKKLEFRPAAARSATPIQPQTTLLLNLTKNEDILLAAMHEKTRYNLRLAEKKGVTVREGGTELFPELWPLLEAASKRDRFRLHAKNYYQKMLQTLVGEPSDRSSCQSRIMLADHEGEALAGMILLLFGGTATYLHGGSSDKKRNVMAPYLLHWQAMRRAKSRGCQSYDFWGIAPEDSAEHPLAGVSRFKRGFGGEVFTAPDSWELPLRPFWYTIYALAKKFTRP
ncbi:peptidoglycan bridge formation glycyltransferase FemA/FemB family protein [Patescibacteria group bacterium]|nr:MAG: peptidoglycan bridge formation glycyltransferase FemA/FemB family protein [Patescibacteria group bacterium]